MGVHEICLVMRSTISQDLRGKYIAYCMDVQAFVLLHFSSCLMYAALYFYVQISHGH